MSEKFSKLGGVLCDGKSRIKKFGSGKLGG